MGALIFYLWPLRIAIHGLPGLMLGVIAGGRGVSIALGLFIVEVDVQ